MKTKEKSGTSFFEQSLFYYINRFYDDTINRYKYINSETGEIYEADIYIKHLNLVIEYDGAYWHKNKVASDEAKNAFFKKNKVFMIRIRDDDLPDLSSFQGLLIKKYSKEKIGIHTNEIIEKVIKKISEFETDEETKNKLSAFQLNYENYCIDMADIYSTFYKEKKEDNITNLCIYKYYDSERNRRLKAENFNLNDTLYFWTLCSEGNHIECNTRYIKKCNPKIECDKCEFNICPMITCCKLTTECKRLFDYTMDYLNNKIIIKDIKKISYYLKPRKYSIQLLKWVIDKDRNIQEINRFKKLFFYKQNNDSTCLQIIIQLTSMDDFEVLKSFVKKYSKITCLHYDIASLLKNNKMELVFEYAKWYEETKNNRRKKDLSNIYLCSIIDIVFRNPMRNNELTNEQMKDLKQFMLDNNIKISMFDYNKCFMNNI